MKLLGKKKIAWQASELEGMWGSLVVHSSAPGQDQCCPSQAADVCPLVRKGFQWWRLRKLFRKAVTVLAVLAVLKYFLISDANLPLCNLSLLLLFLLPSGCRIVYSFPHCSKHIFEDCYATIWSSFRLYIGPFTPSLEAVSFKVLIILHFTCLSN